MCTLIIIVSNSNCPGGFEILFILYKQIFIYHIIGTMNNFNELFKFSFKKLQIKSRKLTYENIKANRIFNFKWKKNGVIVDPLQVIDTKGVNFLSYFLNSEFKSK